MRHYPIHLKLVPERDLTMFRRKRGFISVLKSGSGGRYVGTRIPEAICGAYRVKRLVPYKERERVTCPACKTLLLTLFPQPPVNPRSGMAMPRPT